MQIRNDENIYGFGRLTGSFIVKNFSIHTLWSWLIHPTQLHVCSCLCLFHCNNEKKNIVFEMNLDIAWEQWPRFQLNKIAIDFSRDPQTNKKHSKLVIQCHIYVNSIFVINSSYFADQDIQMQQKRSKMEHNTKSSSIEALRNRRNCMCRLPMTCNYYKKSKKRPIVCYCACSFIQGINTSTNVSIVKVGQNKWCRDHGTMFV